MSSAMEVILLEKVERLGSLGDTVKVKPGYARNYLLPQNKALRATKNNIAYFESQKAAIEKQNTENKKAAEKLAKKLEGLTVTLIRQASETGQLYGSVAARDISEIVSSESKEKIGRNMIDMNQTFKMIGLFPVAVSLHPEVKVEVTINIARSIEEAKTQAKTGKALIAENEEIEATPEAVSEEKAEEAKEEMLEETALEAEKEKAVEDAVKDAEDAEKAAKKAETKAVKAAAKAAEEAEAEANAEEGKAEEDSSEEKAED